MDKRLRTAGLTVLAAAAAGALAAMIIRGQIFRYRRDLFSSRFERLVVERNCRRFHGDLARRLRLNH